MAAGGSAKCPICASPVAQDHRPFCSPRCADVDLNRWFTGVYAVPVDDPDDEDLERLMEDQDGSENTAGEEPGD